MIFDRLENAERQGKQLSVGVVGAGCMGYGIALQISKTPGMRLSWIADHDLDRANAASEVAGGCTVGSDAIELLNRAPVDVFVEATNTIFSALDYCEAAIQSGSHVVLMNAEVDLTYGIHLKALADEKGVVVTSDAGDQHGVLAKMIDEIRLWGFQIVQAGNIKGFLNRYATADDLIEEAAERQLNPIQCCAYTDGTKLNIEMALLSNAFGYIPTRIGMEGPRASNVEQALELFDLENAPEQGAIDYLLGAHPGGGVYVIGHCGDPKQHPYLSYYKLGDSPYYLFYRPYHLCHLETPHAIAQAYFSQTAYLQPWKGRVCDVYAFAKRDVKRGECVQHEIGGDRFYGMVAECEDADQNGWVPIALLDAGATIRVNLEKDRVLTLDQVEFEPSRYLDTFWAQFQLKGNV